MKNTNLLILCAALLPLLAACGKESSGGDTPSAKTAGDKTFTVQIAPLSKVAFASDGLSLEWNKADKVNIFDGEDNRMFRVQNGGASATILGSAVDADTYYALIPYDETASLSGSVISTSISAEQVSAAGGADLKVTAAGKSSGDAISLTPLSALLKFTLNEDAEGVSAVTISADGTLAGLVSIDCGGTPVMEVGSTSSSIKVSANEGTFKAGETYYVSAVPGTVKNLTVSYVVGADELSTSVDGDVVLSAGKVTDLGHLERALTEEEKTFVGTWTLLKYGSRGVSGTPGQYPWVNIDRGVANPSSTDGDYITFKSDGSVELGLGEKSDTYQLHTYEDYEVTLTGNESWKIEKSGDETLLVFGGNAFPLLLGDLDGLGGTYRVVEANEAGINLEINYQGDEGEAILGIFLQPKGKSNYSHRFKSGDFGVDDQGEKEVTTLDDNGIVWHVSVEANEPFYYMNANAGLMLGRAWVSGQSARSALLYTDSFTGKISSVSVRTSRFAPEEGEDKSAADLSVYIGGTKVGTTYSLVNEMTEYSFVPTDPISGRLEVKWETTNDEVNCYFLYSINIVYEE